MDNLFVFDSLDFDVVVDQLVDISDDGVALNVHQDERRHVDLLRRIARTIGAGDGARIDVEPVLLFVRLEFVRVSGDEDVAVELSVDQRQSVGVAPGHQLMSVTKTDFELTHVDDLLFGPIGVEVLEVVQVSPDDVDVVGQTLEVVQRLFGVQVARAEDVLNAARNQQLLELGGQTRRAMRDVQITDHQHQHFDFSLNSHKKIQKLTDGELLRQRKVVMMIQKEKELFQTHLSTFHFNIASKMVLPLLLKWFYLSQHNKDNKSISQLVSYCYYRSDNNDSCFNSSFVSLVLKHFLPLFH